MDGQENEVKSAVKELSSEWRDELMADTINTIKTMVDKNLPLKEVLKYSPSQIDAAYSQAYRLYNTGKYEDAVQLFRVLLLLDPTDGKHYLGLAACMHMLKEYECAVQLYMIAGMMNPKNPIPHFHASDCYIELGDRVSAILCLEMAVMYSEEKPEYQVLKDRALLTIATLKKELVEQVKERATEAQKK